MLQKNIFLQCLLLGEFLRIFYIPLKLTRKVLNFVIINKNLRDRLFIDSNNSKIAHERQYQ